MTDEERKLESAEDAEKETELKKDGQDGETETPAVRNEADEAGRSEVGDEVPGGDTEMPDSTPDRVPVAEKKTDGMGDGVDTDGLGIDEPAEKMLPQSKVNELVARARQEGRDSAMRNLREQYGVNDDEELNGIFGKGQAYDSLNDDYTSQSGLYRDVMAENALLKTRIDPSRWEDVKLILRGKDMDVTEESIREMLPSHPEWSGKVGSVGSGVEAPSVGNTEEPSVLRKLGSEPKVKPQAEDDFEEAKRLFGL